MVQFLVKISLEIVCKNIDLNYELCVKEKKRIPKDIGHQILQYIQENEINLKIEEIRIFEKKIMDLDEFYINERFCNSISFDFLHNHELKYLSVSNIEKLLVYSSNAKLITEEFKLQRYSLSGYGRMFFSNFLQVKNTIIFEEITFKSAYVLLNPRSILVLSLIKKSYKNLKNLNIKNCIFENSQFFMLLNEIFLLENLEEFIFQSKFCEVDMFLTERQKEFGKKLKKLEIPSYFFKINKYMFNNLNNLEILKLTKPEEPLYLCTELFEILSNNDLSTLRDIYIENFSADENIVNFLSKLKNLRKVTFLFNDIYFGDLNFLKNSSQTLEYLFLLNVNQDENYFSEVFSSFLTLKDITLPIENRTFQHVYLDSLMKVLKNCQFSIKKMNISGKNNFIRPFLHEIPRLINLEILNIGEDWTKVGCQLVDFIENHQYFLKVLTFSEAEENVDVNFLKSISKCRYLQKLEITLFNSKHLESIFTSSFQHFDFLEEFLLETISRVTRNNIPEDLDFDVDSSTEEVEMQIPIDENNFAFTLENLSRLKCLRKVTLPGLTMLESGLDEFTQKINQFDLRLESFFCSCVHFENCNFFPIKVLLKYSASKKQFYFVKKDFDLC